MWNKNNNEKKVFIEEVDYNVIKECQNTLVLSEIISP